MNNKIILVGGTAGSGKTTIARQICRETDVIHRIGTGFIREVLRSTNSKEETPALFTFTFRPPKGKDLIENFEDQARLVCNAVNEVIARAYNEGTSIVIEGSHLLPKFINTELVSHFFVLKYPDEEVKVRINGDTHSKRSISPSDLENTLKISEQILNEAEEGNVEIIENNNLTETMRKIKAIL